MVYIYPEKILLTNKNKNYGKKFFAPPAYAGFMRP